MKLDRNMRVGIFTSLIATVVFLYLLKPLISLSSKFFYLVFTNMHSSTIDRLFKEAALGQTKDFAFYSFVLILAMILSCASMYILRTHLVDRMHNQEESDLEVIDKRLKKLEKRVKWVRIAGLVYLVLMAIYLLYYFWTCAFVLRTNTSFNQHMAVLAPYMSETERVELRSEWALMKNKSEHDVIIKKLNDLASSKGITLPKNPIY